MLDLKRSVSCILSLTIFVGLSACSSSTTTVTDVTEIEDSETQFTLSSYVKDSYWLGSDSDDFENVSYLSLVVDLDESVLNSDVVPSYYYSVSKDGEQLFMSDLVVLEGAVINCTFGTNAGDLLPTGSYSVICFDENGAVITSASADVVETPIIAPAMDEDWEPYDDDEYLNSNTFSFLDEDYEGNVNIDKTCWWDYSDTSVGLSAYASDSDVIGFSLVLNDLSEEELYYAFYFTEDGSFSEKDENLEPIFVNRVGLSQYADFASYDIDVKPGKILPGYYYFLVAKDSDFNSIVMDGSCLVVPETMAEIAEDE